MTPSGRQSGSTSAFDQRRVEPGPHGDQSDCRRGAQPRPQREGDLEELLQTLPAAAREAAESWLELTARAIEGSLRAGVALLHAARDPQQAGRLGAGMRSYARELLGVEELERRVGELARTAGAEALDAEALRRLGSALLERSADVHHAEGPHPAYGRILAELVGDEARILRLLANEGPQPLVDLRAGNLIGAGSQLVAANLSMLEARAGCRDRERIGVYLHNLARLGLIELGDSPLPDPRAYQLLEVQPQVRERLRATSRARLVRRSVRLTPLGEELCQACLPLERRAQAQSAQPLAEPASSPTGRPAQPKGISATWARELA